MTITTTDTTNPNPPQGDARARRNVLICDDDAANRYVLKRILSQDLGATVFEAVDGLDALKQLNAAPFDLLVLDLWMPVLDGPETLEAIRSTPGLKNLPVVVLSSENRADIVQRVVNAGVSDFLIKPLSRSRAKERLTRIIGGLRAPGTPVEPPAKAESESRAIMAGETILVADSAQRFRTFCRLAVGSRFNVIEAANGVDALDLALKSKPAAVLIGRDLPLLASDLLAHKIRTASEKRVTILAVAAKSEQDKVAKTGLYDACLVRTFVRDAFVQEFEALIPKSAALDRLLALVPDVRSNLVSATKQVFGMMVKTEVEVRDGQVEPFEPPYVTSTIPFQVGDQFDVEIELCCETESADAFAGSMSGKPKGEEAMTELAKIIAGHVKHAMVAGGLEAVLGVPRVVTVEDPKAGVPRVAECGVRFAALETGRQLDVTLHVTARAPQIDGASPSHQAQA